MDLTDREREIVALLRGNPLLDSAAIAERLSTTRAAINVHLSNLGKKGVILGRGYVLRDRPGVVVIGGANMDIKARSGARVVAGTSNPGTATMGPGGVGRNIAENLARLGTRVQLVAAVGRDDLGESLVTEAARAGIDVEYIHRVDGTTGTYTAVLDVDGELIVAVSDMAATALLGPSAVDTARDAIATADLLVLDANLPGETLLHARNLAADARVRVVIEPVSVAKAAALTTLPGLLDTGHPLYMVTPNRDELAAMTGLPVGTDTQVRTAAAALRTRGVEWVWVRLGARGSLLSHAHGVTEIAVAPIDVADVTGAGDALLAAFCHDLLAGAEPADAARFGHAAAGLTIAADTTVRPDLTEPLVRSVLPELEKTS